MVILVSEDFNRYAHLFLIEREYFGFNIILVSEDFNRYAHLFLIEREYFGFNTLESVVVE
jgi:hypothetical protein